MIMVMLFTDSFFSDIRYNKLSIIYLSWTNFAGDQVRVGCLQYFYPGIKEQMESAEVKVAIAMKIATTMIVMI